jgi:hypothetical protein
MRIQNKKTPTKTGFRWSPFDLYVIPLGLHIPVGWRQPSYKAKRNLKYLKASFRI